MSHASPPFPEPLSEQEQRWGERLLELFALVDARQSEKGVATLLSRARQEAKQHPERHYEDILNRLYAEAEARTHRRLALTASCDSPKRPDGN